MSKRRQDLRNLDFDVRGKDVPRRLFPRGRVKFSLGVVRADDPRDREAGRRAAQFAKLRKWGGQGVPGAWEVLAGLAAHRLDPSDVANRLETYGEKGVAELHEELKAALAAPLPAVQQEIDRYLVWYKANRKDQSYRQVESRLSLLAARPRVLREEEVRGEDGSPTVGGTRIDRVTRADAELALGGWNRANSRNAIHGAGQGLFRWSIQEERERARAAGELPRWSTNPFLLVEKQPAERREMTASEAQVLALFASAQLYQRAYLRAFLHLGMRLAELMHTRRHLDLSLETWIWKIQRRDPDPRCPCASCNGKGWSPKVKRSYRAFHVPAEPAELRGTIREFVESAPCEEGDFLFRDARGKMWTETTLKRDFTSLCKTAGVRYGRKTPGGIVIHDLRATCITQLLLAGEDLGRVAALVGDSADTIMDVYLRPTVHEIGAIVSRGPRYELGTPGKDN